MGGASWLYETRRMGFDEAYTSWQDKRQTREEAARLLGVCKQTFRRYIDRYEDAGLEGLMDRRLNEVSHLKAPVDEVARLRRCNETGMTDGTSSASWSVTGASTAIRA